MKRLCVIFSFALVACGSGPIVTATNASATDVAAKVKAASLDAPFVSPGHWQMTMTVKEVTIPGMPPQLAAKMQSAMGKARVHESCLTPEEAKKPKEDFFAGRDNSCHYDHFTMGNGKIDSAMQCQSAGGTRSMAMIGTYSPDAYHMTITSTGTAGKGGPMAGMAMKMEMDAKRTGECTGKDG